MSKDKVIMPSPIILRARRRSGRLVNRRRALVISSLFIILVTLVYLGGALIPESFYAADFSQKALPPSGAHWFGTDTLGRDMFWRTWKGLSLSLTVGSVASFVALVFALLLGSLAALGGGLMDRLVSWFIDLVMGVPHMVLLILIAMACGRGATGVLIGVALTHWTGLARLIRAEILQLKHQTYIAVSRRLGKSSWSIFRLHMLPHLLPQVLVGLVLLFPHAILHESGLTFLGYGLPAEQPAIGIILSESIKNLTAGLWWTALFPGLALVTVVLLFDALGQSLKQVFNPGER